jgi:hypothetical protein
MVAAYHSLVGLAATVTSIANIMLAVDGAGHGGGMDGVHMTTAFLGDVIGAITLTGSVGWRGWGWGWGWGWGRAGVEVGWGGKGGLRCAGRAAAGRQGQRASPPGRRSTTPQLPNPHPPCPHTPTPSRPQAVAFGKLQGVLDSKPLALPGKNYINWALFGGILTAAGVFATGHDPATAVGALVATAAVGGVLGAHLTASIGAQGGGAAGPGGGLSRALQARLNRPPTSNPLHPPASRHQFDRLRHPRRRRHARRHHPPQLLLGLRAVRRGLHAQQ